MEIKKLLLELMMFWEHQNIKTNSNSISSIKSFEGVKSVQLPLDFVEYFRALNGMESSFPNDTDKNGFLFYPLNQLKFPHEKFVIEDGIRDMNTLIFVDYMQESWWYGVRIIDNRNYEIGIMPHESFFKPITKSLAEFIHFYIHDDAILYNYE